MLALTPPVPGPIVRAFDYRGSPFARGLHRGVDFGAPPGTRVVAPCDGTVAWAGEGGVTLLCARRRITLLPLRAVTAHEGGPIAAGVPVAVVSDAPLHLGVRREGDPFGYVDPAPLLRRPHTVSPPVVGRRPVPPEAPARQAPPVDAPDGHVAAVPAAVRHTATYAPAPPLVWAGFGLMVAAAFGGHNTRVRAARPARATPRTEEAVP